ncbi:MaoC family dehydratase [Actinoplanes sp. URMC 104]|uniref:MaoC family dehydratase n=1 Tax=Actinoplanes sp. URMC 104 TaxID=3423409 RepID=UPI003F19D88A
MPEVIEVNDLATLKGRDLGSSRWLTVTQEQISTFATLTGDEQWIHVDVERARSGPFGDTIAHGFFVLSCSTGLLYELLEVRGASQILNYGLNRVRFTSPTPAGSRVRMNLRVLDVTEVSGGSQVLFALTFEREGQEKPVCVAELLFRYYGQAS